MIEIVAGIAVIAATLAASRVSQDIDLLRFPLAWAGVLIALDGLVRWRRGKSPLASPSDWIASAAASVLFWDVFELVNLRLENWWYRGVSPNPIAGAIFGAVSFATVLPAVRLLLPEMAREKKSLSPFSLAVVGAAMLAVALVVPRYAFPLAWIFLWPLCEAAAALLPPRELVTPLEAGVFWRIAILGIPLGLVWESLNWGCARGWFYTVPFFDRPRLFEMPLPGYLGYLPFMAEAAAALVVLDRLRPYLKGARGAAAIVGVLLVHFGADQLSRRQTVVW